MNIYVDSKMNDDARRREIYSGAVIVHSPSPSALELCRLAQSMIEEAFRPFDPLTVHEHLPAEKCAEILGTLKPQFIHHPRSKECIRGVLGRVPGLHPPPAPGVVTKSSFSTKRRLSWLVTTRMRQHRLARSLAPPLPGKRTLGRA